MTALRPGNSPAGSPCPSRGASHAIIVAGHAIWLDRGDPRDERNWILLDFQRNEVDCYIAHVEAGVKATAADPSALLVFSGGQSRREAGPRSEAHAYYRIADHYAWFGHPEVASRTVLEEFSRDSFENFLFGLCRFKEWTGLYPGHATFVSWIFKQARFDLHREAVGWPAGRFHYLGVNNPPEIEQALRAEARTRDGYRRDPYSSAPEYRAKRDARNPFRRQHGYFTSCPELAQLFLHQGPEPFSGPLPWRVDSNHQSQQMFC